MSAFLQLYGFWLRDSIEKGGRKVQFQRVRQQDEPFLRETLHAAGLCDADWTEEAQQDASVRQCTVHSQQMERLPPHAAAERREAAASGQQELCIVDPPVQRTATPAGAGQPAAG